MDLALYARVLAASKGIVIGGVALAIALAILADPKPSLDDGVPTLTYRKAELWQGSRRSCLRSGASPRVVRRSRRSRRRSRGASRTRHASNLADIYAQFVSGDDVQKLVRARAGVDGSIGAAPLLAQGSGTSRRSWPSSAGRPPLRTRPCSRSTARMRSSITSTSDRPPRRFPRPNVCRFNGWQECGGTHPPRAAEQHAPDRDLPRSALGRDRVRLHSGDARSRAVVAAVSPPKPEQLPQPTAQPTVRWARQSGQAESQTRESG